MKRLRYATRDELAALLADRTAMPESMTRDMLIQLAELDVDVEALVKIEVEGDDV